MMIIYGVVAFRTIGVIRTAHDRENNAPPVVVPAAWRSPKARDVFGPCRERYDIPVCVCVCVVVKQTTQIFN